MFTFKMQSVLNYRQSIEEKKLLEFAEGQKQLELEQDRLSEIQEEKTLLLEQLKALQDDTFHAADISLYHSYHEIYKEKEILQREIVNQAGEKVNCLRAALLEAVQKRKIMDNLSARQLQDYQKKMAAGERGIADETAVMRFIRKKK
jgi:flagellar FliJ protein